LLERSQVYSPEGSRHGYLISPALKDPSALFNSSLDGNVRRAIDIHEGDKLDEAALKDLIRAAVALNLKGKNKPKPKPKPGPA
jgi:hypothetical protein